MANNVKGITIQFDGDTTSLDKALRKVRSEAKDVDKELKEVNRALKFNPGNTELLAQKQQLLKKKIDDTGKSLADLKNIQKQMEDQGVDKQSEDYRRVQREIITTESKLKHFKAELAKVNRESKRLYQVGQRFKDVGAKIEGAGQKLRGVSRAAAAVTVALGGVTYAAGKSADELNTLSKVTGISTDDLQMYAATADLVDVSVEDMAKAHQRLKKSMASSSSQKYFEQLGVATKNADGSLRDANEVFDDTVKALGKMENETERDAISMALMGKSANNLNPLIEDGGRTYEKVSKMMSKYGLEPVSKKDLQQANEFQDSLDTIKLLFVQAVRIVGTKIAGTLVPLMDKVVQKAAKLAEWMGKQSGKTLTIIGAITSAIALLSPTLIILGKVISGVGQAMQMMTNIVGGLAKALMFLAANPVALVIAGVVALVAAFVILWKKSEAFRNFWINLWNTITTKVTTAWKVITAVFSAAWTKIKSIYSGWSAFWSGLWSKVSTGFHNIGTKFGNAIGAAVKGAVNGVIRRVETVINGAIALLNAAISVADALTPGHLGRVNKVSLPRLAEGGILNGARAVIAGEAGPEAIIPLDKLFKQMDKMAEEINGGGVIINVYGAAGQSASEIAAEVERRLIASQKRRTLAWQ